MEIPSRPRAPRLVDGAPLGALTTVLFAAATLYLCLVRADPTHPPYADESWYLQRAVELRDGKLALFDLSVMPVYPAYLWAVLEADGNMLESARCMIDHMETQATDCHYNTRAILWPQALLLAAAMGVAVWTLFIHFGGFWTAVIGGAFILKTGEPQYYAGMYLTEAFSFPLFLLFSAAFLHAARTRRAAACMASGLLLALLAVTRASFLFAILPAVLVFVCWRPAGTASWRRSVSALILGFALVMGPYFFKKVQTQGTWMPDSSTSILVTRVAYNDLTPREWLAGWVLWFPRYGERLAQRLFDAEDYARLDFQAENTIYKRVQRELRTEVGAHGGRAWLIKEKILGDLPWHIAVSLLMAWRAAFVGGIWGAYGLVALVLALCGPWLRPFLWPLIAVTTVPLFTMGVQAFTAPPIERYNIFMLLPMAASLPLLIARAAEFLWSRRLFSPLRRRLDAVRDGRA